MTSLTLLQGAVPQEGTLRVVHVHAYDDGNTPPTPIEVEGVFAPHEGREVQVVAYHFPLGTFDPTKPGGGSCLSAQGRCPYHARAPMNLFVVRARGALTRDTSGGWVVGDTPLQLDTLRGHTAGLVLFPVPSLSDPTAVSLTPADTDNLSSCLSQVQGLLTQVRTRRQKE
jgi:hypothetical protein